MISTAPPSADLATGDHFSCALSAVLLARVQAGGGTEAITRLLRLAGSRRSPEYLRDLANWISYDEAERLWRAGVEVTHHPDLAWAVGLDSGRRLGASPYATVLRSLGAPELVFGRIATTSSKYSTVSRLRVIQAGHGCAEIEASAAPGFPRSRAHCRWSMGLLAAIPTLFGLSTSDVGHETCAAHGADCCRYRLTWQPYETMAQGSASPLVVLREQLAAMEDRLVTVFDTVTDLIGSDTVEAVLARIANRAASEVRATRHLLAVRAQPEAAPYVHSRGYSTLEERETAERILCADLDAPGTVPGNWLVVPIVSDRGEYGRLLAAFTHASFLPEERKLFETYARFAASALDAATSLQRARQGERQAKALLSLARAMSVAASQAEIAQRLVEAVPLVVACDRVAVYINESGRLQRAAVAEIGDDAPAGGDLLFERSGTTVTRLIAEPTPNPVFVGSDDPDHALTETMSTYGISALVIVPLVTAGTLHGVIALSARDDVDRLAPTADLIDRLSGVAAQAGPALQNGRLVDVITHQARHDQLTGLSNRIDFADRLTRAVEEATSLEELVGVFYLDLDGFKPVNDELGHNAGDELLRAVAHRLTRATRRGDTVARMGGDEFVVLVRARRAEELELVSARLADTFKSPFSIRGQRRVVGASVGRAVFPLDAVDCDSLLLNADAAMFVEKRNRRTSNQDVHDVHRYSAPFGREPTSYVPA